MLGFTVHPKPYTLDLFYKNKYGAEEKNFL